MTISRITRSAALALTIAGIAAPSAAALPPDAVSPPAWTEPIERVDLRSPDTKDAAAGRGLGAVPSTYVDLRSPDTKDAAAGRRIGDAPAVSVVKVAEPSPVADEGFDWRAAGVGAGLLLPLLLALGGAFVVVQRHRGAARRQAPSIG
jgi:hypothetical protein